MSSMDDICYQAQKAQSFGRGGLATSIKEAEFHGGPVASPSLQ